MINEYFNLTNSFHWLTDKVIIFIIKHIVESEQRIQLHTRYQQIQGGGGGGGGEKKK